MLITEKTENLQFRSQAMALHQVKSLLLPGKKLGSTSKRPFQSQMKNLRRIKATICALGVKVCYILVELVQHLVKKPTPEKK